MDKPTLIVSQDMGKHNEDIEGSYQRILKGSTWKHTRVVTIIPAGKSIPVRVAFSHWNLIFPPNQPNFKFLAMGMEVGDAYNNAIQAIIDHPELSNWEYILTVEHDNTPPADGVLMLIETLENNKHLACASGLYWTKGETGVPQIWGDPKDPVTNFRPQIPLQNTVQECCGTGMGFALWRISMFKDKKLRKPWFKTMASIEGVGTQDLYFWNDARKHGYRCAVDTRVRVGHYDSQTDIVW
jgi:hypothetical protein